jgi:predicted CoA-binding protein
MNTERVRAVQARHGYQILPVKPGMRLEIHETVGE